MTRGSSALVLVLALVGATLGVFRAVEVVNASGHAPAVSVTVTRTEAGLVIEGRSRLHATPATAWAVLTDYDGIKRFVSTIRESRITGRGKGYVLVEQAAVGRVFLFSRRMTTVLRVHEEPPHFIRFEDVLGRDFESYRGEWQIDNHGDQVEIVYRLTARPRFRLPDRVVRGAFRRSVRSLIAQVGVEIERRSELAGLRGPGRG